MNKVILMGRLTRDPDVRYSGNGSEGGMSIARFTVAVDRRRTGADGQREADFIGCVAFGKQAEFAEKYLHQGSKIALTGRIQTGSYNNKDGQKVYTTDVVAEDMEFAESKAASEQRTGGYAPQGQSYNRAPAQSYAPRQQAPQYQQPAQPQYQAPQAAPQYQPQQAAPQAPAYEPVPQAAPAAPAYDPAPAVSQDYEPMSPAEQVIREAAGVMDDASQVGQGFMNIPEGVEDEGLPFN